MLRRIFSTTVLFAVASGVTCSDESPNTFEDAQAIENAYNEWVEAANSKDIERWSAFLAPKSVFCHRVTNLLRQMKKLSPTTKTCFRIRYLSYSVSR